MSNSATPWTVACQASLSITNSCSLLKLLSIESVMPSNHLILCHPLLLPPSIFPSIRIFSKESVLHIKWPKYWSFSFSISPSNEYSRLISFRMDWFDVLTIQGMLKSLLQHHSSKASILWLSAFFMVQLSHPYVTIGKTIALTRQIFVGKVMCLLFNMLSMLVIAFLPRSKCLLISWLQSPSAVILEPKKRKSVTVSIVFPSICHEVMGLDDRQRMRRLDSLTNSMDMNLGELQEMKRNRVACCAAVHGVPKSQTRLSDWTELMGPDAMIFIFWMLSFKPAFSLSSDNDFTLFWLCQIMHWLHQIMHGLCQIMHYLMSDSVLHMTQSMVLSMFMGKQWDNASVWMMFSCFPGSLLLPIGNPQNSCSPKSANIYTCQGEIQTSPKGNEDTWQET